MRSLLQYILPFALGCLLVQPLIAQDNMTNGGMETIFKEAADQVEGEAGAWLLHFQERILLVISDEVNNRMRIFTPIAEEENLDKSELLKLLKANFHSALDAKYGVYEGYVVSLFTHPLKELTSEQLKDAMKQVLSLAETFGTSYSSTELIFDGQSNSDTPHKVEKKMPKSKKS